MDTFIVIKVIISMIFGPWFRLFGLVFWLLIFLVRLLEWVPYFQLFLLLLILFKEGRLEIIVSSFFSFILEFAMISAIDIGIGLAFQFRLLWIEDVLVLKGFIIARLCIFSWEEVKDFLFELPPVDWIPLLLLWHHFW